MAARKNPRNAPKGSVDPTASTLAQGVSSDPDDPMADMLAQQQAAAEALIAAEEAQPQQNDPAPEATDMSEVLKNIATPMVPPVPTPNQRRMERAQTGTKATTTDADATYKPDPQVPAQGERPMSLRRQRQQRNSTVTMAQQLRQFGRPEGDLTGTATYWIRPGATIRDALIINPNGGIPQLDDVALAAKYGTNSHLYRDKALKKGFKYIGPSLTPDGIKTLIEVMEAEKPDEILFLEEEIELAKTNSKEAGSLEARANEQNRARQLQRRLDLVKRPLDAEEMTRELDRIRRAQELAKLTPSMRQVFRALFTQMLEELGPVAQLVAQGRGAAAHPAELAGVSYGGEGVTAPDAGMVRGGGSERMSF